MKKKIPTPMIVILVVGAVLALAILNMETSSLKQGAHGPGAEPEKAGSIPRGKHGGWLFSKNDLQVEVKIYEKGVPPQFRVYVTDSLGKNIALHEVSLNIHLHRLDRIDKINFKPSGDYLLGDKIVVEPHSFDVKITAQWKGKIYEWEFSQIEARAELREEAIANVRPLGAAIWISSRASSMTGSATARCPVAASSSRCASTTRSLRH